MKLQGCCVPPRTRLAGHFSLFVLWVWLDVAGCAWVHLGMAGYAWVCLEAGSRHHGSLFLALHCASCMLMGVSSTARAPTSHLGNERECHTLPVCSSCSHLPVAPQWSSLVSFCLMNFLVLFLNQNSVMGLIACGYSVCLLFYPRIVPSLELFLSINIEGRAVMSGRQGC